MLTRRQLLETAGGGFGLLGLASLLAVRGNARTALGRLARARTTWPRGSLRTRWRRGPGICRQGEASDLVLRERRAEPCRHLGLQAGAREVGRQIDQGIRPDLQEHDGVLQGRGRRSDEVAVSVQPAGRVRQDGLGDLPEPGPARRQDGVHSLGVHRVEQSLARALHDEHGVSADGLSVRGLVGDLRPGERDAGPSRLRGDERPARPRAAQGPRGELGRGVPAGRVPGHAPAPQGRADRQPRTSRGDDRRRTASPARLPAAA